MSTVLMGEQIVAMRILLYINIYIQTSFMYEFYTTFPIFLSRLLGSCQGHNRNSILLTIEEEEKKEKKKTRKNKERKKIERGT